MRVLTCVILSERQRESNPEGVGVVHTTDGILDLRRKMRVLTCVILSERQRESNPEGAFVVHTTDGILGLVKPDLGLFDMLGYKHGNFVCPEHP